LYDLKQEMAKGVRYSKIHIVRFVLGEHGVVRTLEQTDEPIRDFFARTKKPAGERNARAD